MTVAIKSIADGQLAATKTTIYTVPTAKKSIITSLTLVNTNSSAETINIYFKSSGGTSRRISPKDYSLAASAMMEVLDKSITLEAADILEGDTTTASQVDYVISGGENS